MCGVFGYVGEEKRNLSGYLIDGLSKLEYRGYDSAGIAILSGKTKLIKSVGEIKALRKKVGGDKLSGSAGVGHTRWATHGGVTLKNAHPHTDCTNKFVVVHNGIIENFEKLKTKLLLSGHKFKSETDTEVFAHLVEEELKTSDFTNAVRLAFNKLTGLNAVVAVKDEQIVAFRRGSPLIAGVGKQGNFVSSDIPALASETSSIVLINEDEGVIVTKDSINLVNSKTAQVKKASPKTITSDSSIQGKGKYKHFLLKEIFEGPQALKNAVSNDTKSVKKAARMIRDAWGTYFSACGTAAYAGFAANYFFSEIAKKHVNFAVSSEFPYLEDFLVRDSLLIVASQSGETMDTLEAIRAAKRHRSKVLSLVNVPDSTVSRLSDYTLYLRAGPERAVLSTKSYLSKLGIFLLLAYTLDGGYETGKRLLESTAKRLKRLLNKKFELQIKRLARKLAKREHIYLIGRGVNYATALEGALKIKEASYIHAEGFAGGELKHGVIALIEKGVPVIVVVANDRARQATLSNAIEIKSRGGYIIGVSPKNESVFDHFIKVPDVGPASPIVNAVPLQLLAYHLAVLRGFNPDKPRNLAKSVTVK